MKSRVVALRALALVAGALTIAAACTSSNGSSNAPETPTSVATSTTTNARQTPNSIPFDVGALIGLANGWRVQITKVHRPYSNPKLPALGAGRQYVAVDVALDNQGASTPTVNAAKVFSLGDSTGKVDPVIAVPGEPNGIDGTYPPNTSRSGTLVFDVPARAQLRMAMDGPLIGTQRAIFLVDPPNVGPAD